MPFSTTSLAELFSSLSLRRTITVHTGGAEYSGIVQMIEAEDGSGTCWNVRIRRPEGSVSVFVRTK